MGVMFKCPHTFDNIVNMQLHSSLVHLPPLFHLVFFKSVCVCVCVCVCVFFASTGSCNGEERGGGNGKQFFSVGTDVAIL